MAKCVNRVVHIGFILIIGSFFSGCGGGGSSTSSDPKLIDSAVGGVSYSSATYSGTTGSDGSFKHKAGETTTFKIGGATIGSISSIPTDNSIFPQDLAGIARTQKNSATTNIARFLQSLDDDGDPNNGITISSSLANTFTSNINIQSASSSTLSSLVSQAGKPLVSEATALSHLLSSTSTTTGNTITSFSDTPVVNSSSSSTTTTTTTTTSSSSTPSVVTSSTSDTTPPVFTSTNTVTVNENQTDAIDINATDTYTITYSIENNDSNAFNINPTTGIVTFKTAPDYEIKSVYYFTAKATDSSNNVAEQNITISIKDIVEVKLVDGYVKDANVTDSLNQEATYDTTSKNYIFASTPTYPIKATGGQLIDTNLALDINLTAQSGSTVISPITTFLENDTTLLGKLAFLKENNLSKFAVDYIASNDSELAKLSQLFYVILKDETFATAYKTALANQNPASLDDLFDLNATIDASNLKAKYKMKLLLDKINSYSGTPDGMEAYIKNYKEALISSFDDGNRTILKTGQTTSYPNGDANDRDDGHYQTGVARSYTDNSDGTITDDATTLMWQQSDDDTTRNWSDAMTYCDNLTLGSHTDWRLPTIEELVQLLDREGINPTINLIFTGTDSNFYWSSTTNASEVANAWILSFANLNSILGASKTAGGGNYVRCVRNSN